MRWTHLFIVFATVYYSNCVEPEDETNDVASPLSKINLDSNLRRALLKALTELENEEANKREFSIDDDTKEKIIEKASAASVSIFSNGESITISPVSSTTLASTTPQPVTVLFQKSQIQNERTVTEFEDTESILTSASNNFANQQFGKESIPEKSEKILNQNSILDTDKSITKKGIVTTPQPKVTTEENQAKVEDVQFFSAPLVAAFTVHQDEAGLPKKVEPIFKSHIPTKSQEQIILEKEQQIKIAKQQDEAKLAQQQQETIRIEEFKRQHEKLQLQQKQKALEEEIYRLNLSLRQQHQIFLNQQEELRVRSQQEELRARTQQEALRARTQQEELRTRTNSQQFGQIQQFNPLIEAGRLPLNAQFLPVKNPVDFRTPFAVNNNFNQQSSPNKFNFDQQNQSNRVFRQNTGTGNFGNNFNRNTNSFSIQPAIRVENFNNQPQGNRFFRSNLEGNFLQPPAPQPVQNTRFFRSNIEGANGNFNNFNPQNNNFQLSNLLQNSGAFRGKSPEDLSLISKVLSFNHQGANGVALRPDLRQQFVRNF